MFRPFFFCLSWLVMHRFTWGRSRLPASAGQFAQPFKIQAFAKSPPDAYLPVAHTCFFSLELPRYSTRQVRDVWDLAVVESQVRRYAALRMARERAFEQFACICDVIGRILNFLS